MLRITIEIWSDCRCCTRQESDDGWKSFCSRLPESLHLADIKLGLAQLIPSVWDGGKLDPAELDEIRRAAALIKHLGNSIRQCSPRVVVAMHQETIEKLFPQHLDYLNQALLEVE